MRIFPGLHCTVPDLDTGEPCGRPVVVKMRMMCQGHYDSWRHNDGDPHRAKLQDHKRLPWPQSLTETQVPQSNGCVWLTSEPNDQGYSRVETPDGRKRGHVAAWEFYVGPIPEGHQLDHLCHTNDPTCFDGPNCLHRRCVSIDHLEPVLPHVNLERAHHKPRTHCKNGHEWRPETTYINPKTGAKQCVLCRREIDRKRSWRKRKN